MGRAERRAPTEAYSWNVVVVALLEQGAFCPGGENPIALPGYWRQSRALFIQYVSPQPCRDCRCAVCDA